jgi:hypothetical protein
MRNAQGSHNINCGFAKKLAIRILLKTRDSYQGIASAIPQVAKIRHPFRGCTSRGCTSKFEFLGNPSSKLLHSSPHGMEEFRPQV